MYWQYTGECCSEFETENLPLDLTKWKSLKTLVNAISVVTLMRAQLEQAEEKMETQDFDCE